MKSSSILGCLFAITLCTSLCIAETYTTTKTYYQPVKTVTTTVYDATTNPMYSVNRNDKIQAVQGQPAPSKTVTTTTKTVTNTVFDETTNPMYAIPRNDKIEAVIGQPTAPKTVTTTTTTVKDTVVDKTKKVQDKVQEKVEATAKEAAADLTNDLQSELAYYESLKTCTMGSMNRPKLSLRTYGMTNGLCSFDMAMENPKTGRMVTMCRFNAPLEATKKYAEDKIKFEKSLVGLEKLSTSESTALKNSLSLFTQQYCK